MQRRSFLIGAVCSTGGCFTATSDVPAATHAEALPAQVAVPVSNLEDAAAALRDKHGPRGFTVLAQAPFVVLGDGRAEDVERHATETIAWATLRLREAYFQHNPPGPVEIWLFRDDASYRRWTLELFGDRPDTPYGYYSSSANALLMNISTGGGTLVHEMVHPFIDANFARCPAWFDEGLASLYEQCGERDGQIVGFENWRLPGLQAALSAETASSLEHLLHTSREAFYADDTGLYYAQARYLCFYLQREGKLREFYRRFSAAAHLDPSGADTLQRVLGGVDELPAFEARWRAFVLALHYS